MELRWPTVDEWRREKKLSVAEFSRRSGVPENTIYRGLKNNSKLQPTTIHVIKVMFPEKVADGSFQ